MRDGPRVHPDPFQTPSGSADPYKYNAVEIHSALTLMNPLMRDASWTIGELTIGDERFFLHVFMIEELLRERSLWLLMRLRATRRSQHLNVLEAPRATAEV